MAHLKLDILEDARRSVCGNCEHYNRKKDACTFITLRTGKLGLLKHHYGVRNPKARCPYFYERKWNFVPSFYAWEINRLLMPLTPQEVYEYTRATYLSTFSIIDRLYTKAEKDVNETPMKRSAIIALLRSINAYPNEYQHVEYLDVNYVTGELTE